MKMQRSPGEAGKIIIKVLSTTPKRFDRSYFGKLLGYKPASGGVNNIINRLEAQGYIEMDKKWRPYLYWLTPAGEQYQKDILDEERRVQSSNRDNSES